MEDRPIPAFVLSLIGGILILIPSTLLGALRTSFYGMMGWHMMYAWGFPGVMLLAGLVSGIVILLSSFMLYSRPEEAHLWGTVVLAFSVISLIGAGGFFVGFILAFVGGILALVWKPQS